MLLLFGFIHFFFFFRKEDQKKAKKAGDDVRFPIRDPSYRARTEASRSLSPEQLAVVESVVAGNNVFFTGSAGTGKSHTLRAIVCELRTRYFRGGEVCVVASTGIAATHVGGTTLHSFAGVGIVEEESTQQQQSQLQVCIGRAKKNSMARQRWRQCRVLVVDEVSMVAPHFLDVLDKVGRAVRSCPDKPFGGIQLVISGDFLQLPPVDKSASSSKLRYAFEASCWREMIDACFELKTVYRQQGDLRFVELLQRVRRGVVTDDDDALLKSRMLGGSDPFMMTAGNGVVATKLYTHRDNVERENVARLQSLSGPSRIYMAKDSGEEAAKSALDKGCLAPRELQLRVGAQVLLLKNLSPPFLVNGSRGCVIAFKRASPSSDSKDAVKFEAREYPEVRFDNGHVMIVTPERWETEQAGQVIASRIQVPLCLAWALSVHKCQGMTIEKVEVDISRAWDDGQAYVALSRCTSLNGMKLVGYDAAKIHASAKVLHFYDHLNEFCRPKQHQVHMAQLFKIKREESLSDTSSLVVSPNEEPKKKPEVVTGSLLSTTTTMTVAQHQHDDSWECGMCLHVQSVKFKICEMCGENR